MRKTGKTSLPPCTTPLTRGLTTEEVAARQKGGWGNTATATIGLTSWQIVLRSCITYFNIVFLILAILLLLAGSSVKNLTFLVVVIINTVIGCVQQLRAKHAVDQLSLVAAQQLPTLRDGLWQKIVSHELVLDDIVTFRAGDQICADAKVVQGQLLVNEALLTGEADPVSKTEGEALLSGSFVLAGSARAQLTAVGDDSFAANLAREAKKDPKVAKPEMMRALDKLILVLGFLLIPVGGLLFYQEYCVLSLSLRESVETTVAALVGMIPEGLYLLTSIALALSTLKLTRQNVLVQDMNCIETLARVDVLCVDKTGTITEPALEVVELLPLEGCSQEHAREILAALYHCREEENETAKAVAKAYENVPDWKLTRYIPFTSQSKWSGGEFEDRGTFLVGAPSMLTREEIPQVKEAAAKGLRVLLVAAYDGALEENLDPQRITPLALVLLSGRIRKDARQTFSYFAQQGVTVKVISGDDPATASHIAAKAGIPDAGRFVDVSSLKEEELWDAAESYTVFGRVTPEKKRTLIRALQLHKHTVAMTGDGVNDVLAMKQADCAIAMAGGAAAASQVAQLVLLKDNFSAIPGIVGEGRRVINNIQRAASLFLVKNIFSLGLSLLSFFTGLPYPMIPLHMSIISGLTIGVPSFFLAMEPNYQRVTGKFLPTVLRRALPGGISNIFVVLAAQIFTQVFHLPREQMSTVCTALLATVGMLVLYQVCMPFDKFRRLVWGGMLAVLLLCFTALGSFLELRYGSLDVLLTLFTLMALSPTVYFSLRRIFDWCESLRKR